MERPEELKQHDKVTKYMTFELVERKPKTTVWFIKNNKTSAILGSIYWYGPWRQYVITEIDDGVVFNNGCLNEISAFLTQLNKAQVGLAGLAIP